MSVPKKIAIAGITILGIALALYAIENIRGKAAWENFKKEWEAKGVSFDYHESFPPAVPSNKNFAHTPLLKPLLEHEWSADGTELIKNPPKDATARANKLMAMKGDPPSYGRWMVGQRVNLVKWQQFFRDQKDWPHPEQPGSPGADILHALKKHEPELAELATAMRERPQCRFDNQYNATFSMPLPHLSVLRNAARGATLRALAHLAEKQPDAALANLKLTLHLSECLATEPTLISQLVRTAIQKMVLQVIWEGLVDGRWQVEHFIAIEKKLASIQLLTAFDDAMTWERNGANFFFADFLKKDKNVWRQLDALTDEPPEDGLDFTGLVPDGFLFHNLVNVNRMHLTFTHEFIDAKAGRIYPKVADRFNEAVNNIKNKPYYILSAMLLPSLDKSAQRAGASQTSVDLALLAVRLEQHRVKHKSYPKTLAALPGKQPNDPYSGKAYRYRLEGQRYALHGLGWNIKDDNGEVEEVGEKEPKADLTRGDIVWRYPTLVK
jgi:hypothetical protein